MYHLSIHTIGPPIRRSLVLIVGFFVLFLLHSENAHDLDFVILCTWSLFLASCAAICTVARKVAGDDPNRVRDRAAVIASADRDRATGDRDPRIAGRETTKVETVAPGGINCRGLRWITNFVRFILFTETYRLDLNDVVILHHRIHLIDSLIPDSYTE